MQGKRKVRGILGMRSQTLRFYESLLIGSNKDDVNGSCELLKKLFDLSVGETAQTFTEALGGQDTLRFNKAMFGHP